MATYPSDVDFSTFQAHQPLQLNGQVLYGGPPDLDASFTTISGPRAVLEHIARRLISPPGSYDDPEYGFDINSYMNANLLPQELDALTAAVRNEAIAVEGVDDVVVTATIDSASKALVIQLEVTLTDLTEGFDLVFVLGPDTIPRIYFPAP